VGVSPKRKRKRRDPRPVDRQHLERHCQRCGASLANNLNAPVIWSLGFCSWCEHQWEKMERE
jgi:transcription elongation factor Elf1